MALFNGGESTGRPCCFLIAIGLIFATTNASGQSFPGEAVAQTEGQVTGYRQIVLSEFGGPDVLSVVRYETPPNPSSGDVRIKVLAAGVSFTDIMVRKGIYPGIDAELPYAPGYDLVGVIDELGAGVTGFSVGQRVADLSVWGAYSDYAIRPAEDLVPVPKSLDPAEAVSLILSYTTAYQMLHRVAHVEAGQTVLIHGASGGVAQPSPNWAEPQA